MHVCLGQYGGGFQQAAIGYYQSLGVTVKGIMTDNGPCYTSKLFREACARLDIWHRRTRPFTPRTNGKAERFIQTALREWAYVAVYQTSLERRDRLPVWIHRYNCTDLTAVSRARCPSVDLA